MTSRYTSLTEEQVQEMFAKNRVSRNRAQSIINPDADLEPEVELEPEIDPGPEIESVPEIEPELEFESVTEIESEPEIESVTEIEPELEFESVTEIESEPEVESELPIEPELEFETEPEPEVELDAVSELEPIDEHKDQKYKIAIFFRGPLRGDVSNTIEYIKHSLDELSATHTVHSYLTTWGTTFNDNVKTILNAIEFDNVILQTAPTDEQIRRFVKRADFGCYPVSNVYRMYYQSKTALDVITNAYDYDYIVHSRTDVKITFGEYLNDWFVKDQYNTPPSGAPWLCDWVGVATPDIMYKAWNYGTLETLGNLIDDKHVPEHILLDIMKMNGVTYRSAQVAGIFLDPNRVEPGDRL